MSPGYTLLNLNYPLASDLQTWTRKGIILIKIFMIEFKKDVNKLLPYDREQFSYFIDDDFKSLVKWYGVSFQLGCDERKIELSEYLSVYEPFFTNLILKLDKGSSWILNHEYKDFKWFPNLEDNLNSLRFLFKQRNIPNSFIGALVFTNHDLLKFTKDIISYPYVLPNKVGKLYRNIDISHGKLQFIIKISGHLCIDLFSTDKELLKEIINEKLSDKLIVKEYRGSSI